MSFTCLSRAFPVANRRSLFAAYFPLSLFSPKPKYLLFLTSSSSSSSFIYSYISTNSFMGEIIEYTMMNQTPPTRPMPFREDCWSEEATSTLVDAWGKRYMELNRGNLRQKDWQQVADAVNALHGHTKKTQRTDVQCKNRIDTLKKKYKIEKAKIVESNGTLISSWPFFNRLDVLIGNSVKHQYQVAKYTPPVMSLPPPVPMAVPMGVPLPYPRPIATATATPVILPQKRPLAPSVDDSYFRRNYSAVAAAAAAAADVDSEEDEEEDEEEIEETREEGEGIRMLAKAIEKFGETYERVEVMKQKQMVELEKKRMQLAKDLEVQRMHMFVQFAKDLEVQNIKQAKRSTSDDIYS